MKPYSKYFEKIRIRPDRAADAKPDVPRCQWDGCDAPGVHRAPVGRHKEGEYFRFCVDHAREYNKNYNYFSGLSDGEVARYQREALTGHRPTWKFAGGESARAAPDFSQARSGRASYHNRMGDPYNLFGGRREAAQTRERRLRPLEAKALETLGLGAQATGEEIKARYKSLVKRHHPDANGGDRGSEDRLRNVLEAYRLLKQAGFC